MWKKKVSDSAKTCPECGYDIQKYIKNKEESEFKIPVVYLPRMYPKYYLKEFPKINTEGKIKESVYGISPYKIDNNRIMYIDYNKGMSKNVPANRLVPIQRLYVDDEYMAMLTLTVKGTLLGDNSAYGELASDRMSYKFRDNGTCIEYLGNDAFPYWYWRKDNIIVLKGKKASCKGTKLFVAKNDIWFMEPLFFRKGETYNKASNLLEHSNMVNSPKSEPLNLGAIACPYCKSRDCKKIGVVSRGLSFGLFGFGSSKVGKQWHCNTCKSDF